MFIRGETLGNLRNDDFGSTMPLDFVTCLLRMLVRELTDVERYESKHLEAAVLSISNCFISMPGGLSCKLTVYFSRLMRELRHHCNKQATRNRILVQGNTGWKKAKNVFADIHERTSLQ